MFWVRIRLGGREYLGVLDTGATISIVAKKILPCGSLKNTMTTAAIRMGDGHVVHSCRDCEVEVPMGSRTIAHRFYVMDTEAFDFVLGTDFFVQHSQIQSLTLQAPYLLYVDHGSGRESVPLEQSEHTSSYLRLSKEEPSNMMAASKTEDYQLLKRYPEPMAHGPEACEPSHPLWPMARRPASRHTRAGAVNTGYPCSLTREIWNPISNQ